MGEIDLVFIDANIFLEIALRNEKSELCKQYIRKFLSGEVKAFTSDFIIYACLLSIQNKAKNSELMKDFLTFIDNLVGLEIHRPSPFTVANSVELMSKTKLDFDDSLVVACMDDLKIKKLVSLDKHFDKIEGIKRIEP
ncbi:type II toxin-antitoxin system VapC family toxin [archaeon]|nr:type II toxin-antitoxin system VapC family toxin [archaeon]